MEKKYPILGVGIIIVNKEGNILVGKRIGGHAQKYSIPGGHLELGETFEQAAIREVKEETDLDIFSPKVISISNNIETFKEEGVHYVSVILVAKEYSGELKNMELTKCGGWNWVNPKELPEPHFDASALGVKSYLEGSFYI